jgi:hypothetical protein
MGLLTGDDNDYYGSSSEYGGYQFTSLEDVINQFIIAYVGEDKNISKVKRIDVAFHAQRALQEMSFDVFKSTKDWEIIVPDTLSLVVPRDYVNYVKLSFTDDGGVKRVIYPTSRASNPTNPQQTATPGVAPFYTLDSDKNVVYDTTSDSLQSFISGTATSASGSINPEDDFFYNHDGTRYGINPEVAQANGTYFIDESKGTIHFSSSLTGKTLVLEYISDSLGTDAEMKVHKFAEEAMYKYIAHAVLATRANTPEGLVQRYKREAFAAKRTAKLRLSNIKLEEITQILRGKSKQIKH